MNALVINLNARPHKWENMKEEFKDILLLERVPAISSYKPDYGCFKSHQKCVKMAKERGWKTVLVLEDDCVLIDKKNFKTRMQDIKKWLEENSKEWHIFLGASNYTLMKHITAKHVTKNELFIRVSYGTTTHFTIYNHTCYDLMINARVTEEKYRAIDLWFHDNRLNVLTPVPFLALQRPGYSDIMQKNTNFNDHLIYTEKNLLKELEYGRKYLIPELTGGLGNRLFAVASSYGIAKRQNKFLIINESYIQKNNHSTNSYLKNMLRKCNIVNTITHEHKYEEPESDWLRYSEIPDIKKNLFLFGYYQHEKYFIDYRNDILDLFEAEPERKNAIMTKYPDLNDCCFIHIRRNDYVNHPIHYIDLEKYYVRSINYITDKNKTVKKFYVVSDDLEWCKHAEIFKKKELTHVQFEFLDNKMDEVDAMYLMSYCSKGGVCPNSTFSWWGSYLNPNEDKIVTFPNKWYNNKNYLNVEIGYSGASIIEVL